MMTGNATRVDVAHKLQSLHMGLEAKRKRTLEPAEQRPSKKKKGKQQQGGQGREQTAAGGKDPVAEAEWRPPPLPPPDTAATLLDTQIRSLAQLIGETDDSLGRKAALKRITMLVRRTLSGGKSPERSTTLLLSCPHHTLAIYLHKK